MFPIETYVGNAQEAGIYSWLLNDDRLFGDTAVAALFGLDPALTVRGLPLSSYMERVHIDDQGMLKVLITKAVRDGLPYSTEYRVQNAMGQFAPVMAVGRCFRDPIGNPTLYSRIIYPIDQLRS